MSSEDVLRLSGGGDWHCAYLLLYGPRILRNWSRFRSQSAVPLPFFGFLYLPFGFFVPTRIFYCLRRFAWVDVGFFKRPGLERWAERKGEKKRRGQHDLGILFLLFFCFVMRQKEKGELANVQHQHILNVAFTTLCTMKMRSCYFSVNSYSVEFDGLLVNCWPMLLSVEAQCGRSSHSGDISKLIVMFSS